MNGYAGKILRLDLTHRKISAIETRAYEHWIGGHGMGAAVFWDLVTDKTISGFDPGNVVTIMTSPLTGTMVPGASSRTEVQGIGVQSYPIGWFTRSNLGGRFGPMMKFAGWDGIVIEGKADRPVWVDIRDNDVRIKDGRRLWGLDTWATQQEIWREVCGGKDFGDWFTLGAVQGGGRSTQRPAVLTIGPAGENLSRLGCLIHDAGNAAGQGGFGGVWGSKNLKAVSVIGTGGIEVADPNALMEARLWAMKNYAMDINDPERILDAKDLQNIAWVLNSFGGSVHPVVFWERPEEMRPQACLGCHAGCRGRHADGHGNESICAESAFYAGYDRLRHSGMMTRAIMSILKHLIGEEAAMMASSMLGKQTAVTYKATDLLQQYGINAFEAFIGLPYLRDLYKMGVLGAGKEIDCDLPFEKLGEIEFVEKFVRMIAFRQGIGDDMAEGFFRAAQRWGRLAEDSETGLLRYPHWGLPDHYEPRAELEWGYGSIMGDRDINEHGINTLFWMPSASLWMRKDPPFSAEEVVKIYSDKMIPFEGDQLMLDFSSENMYSEHIAKLVAWHRHYSRFWKQSVLYCDFRFPDFLNPQTPDKQGLAGEGEPKFLNVVTGRQMSFADGMEMGRKIWNLDNAVWTLQGRHRDMVHFAPYIYKVPLDFMGLYIKYYMPGREKGEWKYLALDGRHIDKENFEEWKSKFYRLEGWAEDTGWPQRKTLESLQLAHVAEELENNNRLGEA